MSDESNLIRLTEFEQQLEQYGIKSDELQKWQEHNASVFMALNLPTPAKFIKKRPAKGGGEWKYVEGSYVIDRLNFIFGINWSFEGDKSWVEDGFAICNGHLVIHKPDGRDVRRFGQGSHPVTYLTEPVVDPKSGEVVGKRKTGKTLDLGNDLKAAETDALKRAARTLGIGLDLYSDEISNERRLLAAASKRHSGLLARAEAARQANVQNKTN